MDNLETDIQLMRLLIEKDDPIAFERLYYKYKNGLVRFSYGYTFNQNKAEEMMQETFLKVYKNKNKFDLSKSFRTWLWTICKNTNLDHMDKVSSKQMSADENEVLNIIDEHENALELLIKNSTKEDLEKVITQLPLSQREALLLWMNDDLSFDEMSSVLQKSPQAIKNLIHRAKDFLRKNL